MSNPNWKKLKRHDQSGGSLKDGSVELDLSECMTKDQYELSRRSEREQPQRPLTQKERHR